MSNQLNYANYSFEQIVIQLQNSLKKSSAWKDIYRSSSGERLIEFLAAVLNLVMFYAERRAEESYLSTAQNRSSIINIVSLLNYQPKRKTSSAGNLQFSVDSPTTKIIYIPKYTECQSVEGVKFLTNEDAAIQKGQTSVTVSSIQGELSRMEITANGLPSQEYLINSTEVENSADTTNPTLRVVVNGVLWSLVTSFIDSGSTSQHYRIMNEKDGKVTVLFGDDTNGKSPESGWTIQIQYIKSAGLSGNVTYLDKITTLNDTIYDEDGGSVSVSVTNISSFLGGDDAEDIEEIRYEAPRVFKTGDRGVSRTDLIAILENYSGVASANVWGEKEEAEAAGVEAVEEMRGVAKICLVLQEWGLPDSTFKNTLSEYLYNKSTMTVRYVFVTPVFLNAIPVLDIKVTTGHSLSQTQADVEAAVAEQFVLGDTTKLGTVVKYSAILAAVHDLDGVAFANMVLEIRKDLVKNYSSDCDWGEALDALPIKPETTRLFIADTYITTDVDNKDGTGTFTASGDYTVSGTINYTTGVVLLDVSSVPSSVYVRYQQKDNVEGSGNIVPNFDQICKLVDVDIQTIIME